jgi:hypothetical protein
VLASDWNAGRVDLRVAGVGEHRSSAVGPPGCRRVAPHRVGREIEHVAVTAGREHDGVAGVALDLARDHVADHDSAGPTVDGHEVEQLAALEHGHPALAASPARDLAVEGRVRPEQELLTGLTAAVEGPRDLGSAERAVGEEPSVFAGEGHALGHALVDDVRADLRQAIDVRLTRAEVAALDRVVEEAEHAVAVFLVVLGRVDSSLSSHAVRPSRAVVVAEAVDVVALLSERRCRAGSSQAGPDHEDSEPALVARREELLVEAKRVPLLRQGARGLSRVQLRHENS